MTKYLFLLFFLFSIKFSSNIVNPDKLSKEIAGFNDVYKYEASIIKLEEIINSNKATNFDRYHAYLQKALTYKRVYNYPEVLNNLNIALSNAKNSDFWEEADVRILTEKMFVEFDSRKFEEARKLIHAIGLKNTNLLTAETYAFYLNAKAVIFMLDQKYEDSESTLNQAIAVLEKNDSKHLPMIYAKMIGLAEYSKDKEMALDAFRKGMQHADEYKLDVYRMSLYYTMAHFFVTLEDYKNAYYYESRGAEISSRYNASFQNGKLSLLEKSLLEQRKNSDLDFEKKKTYLLAFTAALMFILLIVAIKFYQVKKHANHLIAKENDAIRKELQMLMNTDRVENSIRLENYNLTQRQYEIINLVKEGKTNKEIGANLYISENTVKYHLKTIYTLLGIENRWELK